MKITKQQLIDPPKKYRSLPFWSWNAKLDTAETARQVAEMDENGIGGYFMHARGGLKTEYMSEEWMDNIRTAVRDGKKRGMAPWGYDENGWPSGFGSGAVNGLGVKYQQKYLHMDITDSPVEDDVTVGNVPTADGKNRHFYFSLNRFYVDTMDAEVTDAFIASTHEKYKEALGEEFADMAGFFTDEPQMSRKYKGIPWSLILPREYKKAYGEELLPVLHHLFETTEEAYRTRYRYWHLVTRLFSENFMGRIYDWCNKNGTRLTGHMVCEETFASQLDCNGSCMPNYMYLHIPGVDKLGRGVDRALLVPQVTSVAAQTGKKQILTESFAMCGWDVTFEELKWILEWQMVKGVNLLCQHLEGYSLGGLRKRDYPAGHFFQNPWWKDYKKFMDFAARMGMLLAEGEVRCEVLVLHTIGTAWMYRSDDHNWQQEVNDRYCSALMNTLAWLDKNQVLNHLGDETVMEKLGSVDGSELVVGEMRYKTVIVPPCSVISSHTLALLQKFKAQGGNLIFVGEIPAYVDGEKSDAVAKLAEKHIDKVEDVCALLPQSAHFIRLAHADGSLCDVQYIERKFDDFTMYYFVNTYSGKERARLTLPGKSIERFDYDSGETVPYPFEKTDEGLSLSLELEPKGSLVLFAYNDDRAQSAPAAAIALAPIKEALYGVWDITSREPNALTLDFCDVWFDGQKAHEHMPVLDIQEIANAFERKVHVRMDFKVKSEFDVPGALYLVVEEPEQYMLTINGKPVEKKACGYFRDPAFVKLDISGCIVRGENSITLETDFVQPQHIYDTIKECYEFEAMRNKLWYDREIEAVYLLGDFCVSSDTPYRPSSNHSYVTDGDFTLVPETGKVTDGNIALQGYPFYTGKMTLEKTITLSEKEIENRVIELERMGAVLTKLTVNGKLLSPLMRAPYRFDLSGLLHAGENTLSFELTNNFRNLLGPLHLGGESYSIAPGSFHHVSKIFGSAGWTDAYAFLEYGLFFK